MDFSEDVTGAPPGTLVPQELLEEMLWFYRVEDGEWWGDWSAVVVCCPHKERTLAAAPCHSPLLHGKLHMSFKAGGAEAEGSHSPEGSG